MPRQGWSASVISSACHRVSFSEPTLRCLAGTGSPEQRRKANSGCNTLLPNKNVNDKPSSMLSLAGSTPSLCVNQSRCYDPSLLRCVHVRPAVRTCCVAAMLDAGSIEWKAWGKECSSFILAAYNAEKQKTFFPLPFSTFCSTAFPRLAQSDDPTLPQEGKRT